MKFNTTRRKETENKIFQYRPIFCHCVIILSLSFITLGNRCKCHGSLEMTILRDVPCHSRCGTLKNPHCSHGRALCNRAITTCFYDSGLSRMGFKHPTFRLRSQRSNPLRHRRMAWKQNKDYIALYGMSMVWHGF